VHQIDRRAGEPCERKRTRDRLLLDERRPGRDEAVDAGSSCRDRLVGERLDRVVVLTVHADEQSECAAVTERLVERPVGGAHPELGEGEEELDRARAGLPQRDEVVAAQPVRLPDRRVELDVCRRLRQRLPRPPVRGRRGLARLRGGERDERRRSACESFGACRPEIRERVGVGVDAARQHEAAAGVEVGLRTGDLDVAPARAVSRHDQAARDPHPRRVCTCRAPVASRVVSPSSPAVHPGSGARSR
jgi:hypothetical protein